MTAIVCLLVVFKFSGILPHAKLIRFKCPKYYIIYHMVGIAM